MGFWKKVKKVVSKVTSMATKAVGILTQPVAALLQPITKPIVKTLSPILKPIATALAPVTKVLAKVSGPLSLITTVANFVAPGVGAVLSSMSKAVNTVANLPGAIVGGVTNLITGVAGSALSGVAKAATDASPTAGKLIGGVTGGVSAAQSAVERTQSAVQGAVQGVVGKLTAPVRDAITSATGKLTSPGGSGEGGGGLEKAVSGVGTLAGFTEKVAFASGKAVAVANYGKAAVLSPLLAAKAAAAAAATSAEDLAALGATAGSKTGPFLNKVVPLAKGAGLLGTGIEVYEVGSKTLEAGKTDGLTSALGTLATLGGKALTETLAVGRGAAAGATEGFATTRSPAGAVAGAVIGGGLALGGVKLGELGVVGAAKEVADRFGASPTGQAFGDWLLAGKERVDAFGSSAADAVRSQASKLSAALGGITGGTPAGVATPAATLTGGGPTSTGTLTARR